MKTHLGFLKEVLFGYLSYGVQVGTDVLFSHSYSLFSVGTSVNVKSEGKEEQYCSNSDDKRF